MMKRWISFILSAALLFCTAGLRVDAAHVSETEAAETLETLGLLKGTDAGLELSRLATRGEALVMLLRLLGLENAAVSAAIPCPFPDGDWAASYIGYACCVNLVSGVSATEFGTGSPVGCRDYLTMVLRALGYRDAAGDFSWAESISFSDRIGLTHGEYDREDLLFRSDLALISYTALLLQKADGSGTVLETLYRDGVVSASALKTTRLAAFLPTNRAALSPEAVYEKTSSAVFFIEVYETEEDRNDEERFASGSGFFLTPDGVALLSYHELDGGAYARVTTSDGRKYDVTGVLQYDPLWDYAIVRVSQTDLDGRVTRQFPYLDVGDGDLVIPSCTVYTVSNPLGLTGSISSGMVSGRDRTVDDPDYPSIQFTAPISRGSSGGPLLDRWGDVVGVIYASYVDGQNINLAVPLAELGPLTLTGSGQPLSEVKETVDAQKAIAELTASETEITLEYDEEKEILITHDCPVTATVKYTIHDRGIVSCEWGSFQTKFTVPLKLTGVGDGETDVVITFAEDTGNEDAELIIHVTVIGAPEELEEDADFETGISD